VESPEASCVPEIPLKKRTLKLHVRLRKALLRCSVDYNHSRFEYNYVSGLDYSIFSNVDKREQPRCFGLILDIVLNQIIGEAALNAPIHLNQKPVDDLNVSQEIAPTPTSSSEMELWCGPVHVQKTKERHLLTVLIFEPESGSVLVYPRLGLLFLTDRS
jgi:hypothetical protein